jgi:predicted permease
VAVAIALRLAVAPLLMIGFSALIDGVPDAYLLQAAMPAGVNSVVVAHAYGLDLKIAASAVAWTTMLVVLAGMIVPSVL